MKKKRIIWRSFLLLLVAFLLVSAVSCDVATPSEQDTTAVDTTADTTTEEEIPTETESEPQKPAEDADDGNYRILIAADLHCTHQETWYGVAGVALAGIILLFVAAKLYPGAKKEPVMVAGQENRTENELFSENSFDE